MTHQIRGINLLASFKVPNLLYRPGKKGIFCSYRAVHFLLISKVLKMVKKEVWGEGSGTNSYQQPDLKLISEMKRLLSIFGVMYSEVNLSVGPMVRSQVLQRDMCSRDTNTIDI